MVQEMTTEKKLTSSEEQKKLLDEKSEEYLFDKLITSYSDMNLEQANNYADKILEINPFRKEAWRCKGDFMRDSRMLNSAIECYDEALKIDPQDAGLWNNQGAILNEAGQTKEAIECLEESLRLKYDGVALGNLGLVYADLREYNKALKYYDKATEIIPDDELLWVNKGLICEDLEKISEAMECYETALKINPEYNRALFAKGSLLTEDGKFREAMNLFILGKKNTKQREIKENKYLFEKYVRMFNKIHSNEKILDIIATSLKDEGAQNQGIFVMHAFFTYASTSLKDNTLTPAILQILKQDPAFYSEQGILSKVSCGRNNVCETNTRIGNLEYILKRNKPGPNTKSAQKTIRDEYVKELAISNCLEIYEKGKETNDIAAVVPPIIYLEQDNLSMSIKTKIIAPTLQEFEKTVEKDELTAEVLKTSNSLSKIHVIFEKEVRIDNEGYYFSIADSQGNVYMCRLKKFDYEENLTRRFLSRVNVDEKTKARLLREYRKSIDVTINVKYNYPIHGDANACNALLDGYIIDFETLCLGNPVYDQAHLFSNIDFVDLDKRILLDNAISYMKQLGVNDNITEAMKGTYTENLKHIIICKVGSNINQGHLDRAKLYLEDLVIPVLEKQNHLKLIDAVRECVKPHLG